MQDELMSYSLCIVCNPTCLVSLRCLESPNLSQTNTQNIFWFAEAHVCLPSKKCLPSSLRCLTSPVASSTVFDDESEVTLWKENQEMEHGRWTSPTLFALNLTDWDSFKWTNNFLRLPQPAVLTQVFTEMNISLACTKSLITYSLDYEHHHGSRTYSSRRKVDR